MSRVIFGLLATLLISSAMPIAEAQGVSLGPTNRTSTQLPGARGSYFYPGFGWSSYPLNNGYYGTPYGTVPIYGTPVYTPPVAVPGVNGFFRIGNARINYWQAPSGYYYPWGIGAGYTQQAPVYIINQGVTTPQLPPLSSMFGDMEKYLDDSKDKAKLSQADYARLFRRLQDVRGKFDHERAASGGAIDPNDEANIRRDVDLLAAEISRAVKPVAAK